VKESVFLFFLVTKKHNHRKNIVAGFSFAIKIREMDPFYAPSFNNYIKGEKEMHH